MSSSARAKRKLAALLYADAVAFSRLMESDEAATVQALRESQRLFRTAIEHHGGRMVDTPGDALLADFASAIDAVSCAVEVQEALAEANASVVANQRMLFRIGINTGDVLDEGGALFGDGVNIAARVQALAEPGGLCLSGKTFDEIEGRVRATFEFAGEKKVKNIAKPIRIYKWLRQERLTLRFLGETQALRGAEVIPLPQSKKTRALLAYLALTGKPHRRDRLCALLWDVPDDPRAALRWSLSKLRPIVDEPRAQRIITDRDTVAFEARGAQIDVLDLRARLADGIDSLTTSELEDSARALSGTFLADAELTDFFALSAWCASEREALRTTQAAVLEALVARLSAEPLRALEYARMWCEIMPAAPAAQAAMQRLQDAMRGIPSSPSPVSTVVPAAAEPAESGAPAPVELSIAVLPFDNLTPEAGQEYFGDGMMEDLITALSKISELLVISRSSSVEYRGRAVAPVRAAAELGVRYVLQGSFRRAGQRIRVTAQLIDARGGRTLWADRYDRDIEDILAVQDDITKEIVTALKVKLTLGEQARLWRRHAHTLEAYEDYLRGLECYNRFTQGANRQARQHFESAAARSPDFAVAHHYLGWTHVTDAWFGWTHHRDASLSLAIEHANRAIALDDSHADGYAVRAFVSTLRGDHDRAVVEAERAAALNPGGATVCHTLALVRLFAGDPEEAASLERQALRLSPLAQDNFLVALGLAYCMSGRHADAAEVLAQAVVSKPHWLTVRTLLALVHHELGHFEEAQTHVAEVRRHHPHFSLTAWARIHPYRDPEDLRRHMDGLRRAGLPDPGPSTAEMVGTKTHYARSGDVNIAYQVTGRGPVDLVTVPGWVSHVENAWDEASIAPFFHRITEFARLILLDRRGTGLSDPVHNLPTLEERMDDLRAVMDAVGSERAFLFGISESGPMCTLFAATYPDRCAGLVLCNTFAHGIASEDQPWATTPKQWQLLQQMIDTDWGTGVTARVFAPSRAGDAAFVAEWGRFERQAVSKGAMRTILAMAMNTDVRHVLPSVHVPTLVIHRTHDQSLRVEGARYLARHIPNAQLIEVAGTDHFPWTGDPKPILDALERFVTGTHPRADVDRVLTTILCADAPESARQRTTEAAAGWREVLGELRGHLRGEIARFHGREIDAGDGVSRAAFDGPARAIRCAGVLRAAAQRFGVTLRAGVHTGECAVLGTELSGFAVDVATAVCRAAAPGEVLVSRTVTDLIAGSGLRFDERGIRVLKGITGEWPLYAAQSTEDASA